MAEPFLGQISVFGFNFAPLNWALCRGQVMAISQNTALFSLLGTNFGGNGTTNFGLPNMQGNVGIGQGQLAGGSLYDLGDTGGSPTIALSRDQSPTHEHNLMGTVRQADSSGPANKVLARVQGTGTPRAPEGDIYNTNAVDTPLSAPISEVGNGQPHDNLQPFLVLNYCICINGIFPQRG